MPPAQKTNVLPVSPFALEVLSRDTVPAIIRDEDCCEMGCEHVAHCAQAGTYPAPLLVSARDPDYHRFVSPE